MVLGPDLAGWKLSEARVWAMLRDEDALQARHTLPHTRTSTRAGRCHGANMLLLMKQFVIRNVLPHFPCLFVSSRPHLPWYCNTGNVRGVETLVSRITALPLRWFDPCAWTSDQGNMTAGNADIDRYYAPPPHSVLKDWKENSLSLAETKKTRLIIRAASKAKTSAPTLRRGPGGATPGKLAPPPRPTTGTPVRRR